MAVRLWHASPVTARRPQPARSRFVGVAWWLALALVVAQALGVAHRIEHGGRLSMGVASLAAAGPSASIDVRAARRPAVAASNEHARGHAQGSASTSGRDIAPTHDVALADAQTPSPAGDGTHDCSAFDHATVADAAPSPVVPTATSDAVRLALAPPPTAPLLAAQAGGYLARGPPAA